MRYLAALLALVPAISYAACMDRADFMSQAAQRYSEYPIERGLTGTGWVVEVLVSDEGTWTLIATSPEGVSCLLADGIAWQAVESKKGQGS